MNHEGRLGLGAATLSQIMCFDCSAQEKFPFEGEHVPAVLVLRKIPMADGQFRLLQFDVSSTSLKVVEPHGETSETNETTSL